MSTPPSFLHPSPEAALKVVREDYQYWTGRLTDTSLQLSFAVLGANWATFGSVNRILGNYLSKLSVALVIFGLGVNLCAAFVMGELLRKRTEYAEKDPDRWKAEFDESCGKAVPWPYTEQIDNIASYMRWLRGGIPVVAGIVYIVALFGLA